MPPDRKKELERKYNHATPRKPQERPCPQGHVESLERTKRNIYRLGVGKTIPGISNAMSSLNKKLRDIAGNCHPTEKTKDYSPAPPVPIVEDDRPTNKMMETIGDLVMKIYIPKKLEQLAQTKMEHHDMSRRIQQNYLLSHLVNQTDLMDHPDVTVPWGDSVANRRWDPSSKEAPPKYLANFVEGVLGVTFCAGGMAAVGHLLDPIMLALHTSIVNQQLRHSPLSERQKAIWDLPDVHPRHAGALRSLVRFIKTERMQIRKLGHIILRALPREGPRIRFDNNGTLITFHSHVMELGEGLTLSVTFTGWLRTRLHLLVEKLPVDLPTHIMRLEQLVTGPVVLAHLAYALGLHHHVHHQHKQLSSRAMANLFIATVGFFESHNGHQLFVLERLFELLANVAHDLLDGPCVGILLLVEIIKTLTPYHSSRSSHLKRVAVTPSQRRVPSSSNELRLRHQPHLQRENLVDLTNAQSSREQTRRQVVLLDPELSYNPIAGSVYKVPAENTSHKAKKDSHISHNSLREHYTPHSTRSKPQRFASTGLSVHKHSNDLDDDELPSDTDSNSSISSWPSDYIIEDGNPLSEKTLFNLSMPRKSRAKLANRDPRELDDLDRMATLGPKNFLGSMFPRSFNFQAEPAGFFYDYKPDALRDLGLFEASFPGSETMRDRQETEWVERQEHKEQLDMMKKVVDRKPRHLRSRYTEWLKNQREKRSGEIPTENEPPVVGFNSDISEGSPGGSRIEQRQREHKKEKKWYRKASQPYPQKGKGKAKECLHCLARYWYPHLLLSTKFQTDVRPDDVTLHLDNLDPVRELSSLHINSCHCITTRKTQLSGL
ncbi:hypothetical protein SISNIDRAFT_468891 [Sistotremastrum niveocremeum HHB9708]|uniref:Uncharacterized protein n=1 Tax=Sistotremastrum niveocremeum HHB9708 TaxID=1314777 RepID=A0A164QS87_9AGAM|nr:hypothetical protein SISNIDRAFT_468891 [Sistotremastrum niveocremeum HHB9708]